jgi:sirohydrochlorin cobaltochelatase
MVLEPPFTAFDSNSAYLLVAHGSPDPRPQVAMDGLVDAVAQKIQHLRFAQTDRASSSAWQFDSFPETHATSTLAPTTLSNDADLLPQPLVAAAYLECHPQPLHQQIREFAQQARCNGFSHIQILPLFLLPGRHVMEDIPTEVALAQQVLGEDLQVTVQPYLGVHPNLGRLLATYMAAQPVESWILLAHGSRREGGNAPIAQLADRLGAIPAYWSVSPSLETVISELATAGSRRIAILPYFLFKGGITDAIAHLVQQLAQQFPTVNLQLMPPLEDIVELSDLVIDLTLDVAR